MRNHLQENRPSDYEAFRDLADDIARREWLAEFLMDPMTGGCKGRNYTTREVVRDVNDATGPAPHPPQPHLVNY